jgi:hypothetical protein
MLYCKLVFDDPVPNPVESPSRNAEQTGKVLLRKTDPGASFCGLWNFNTCDARSLTAAHLLHGFQKVLLKNLHLRGHLQLLASASPTAQRWET